MTAALSRPAPAYRAAMDRLEDEAGLVATIREEGLARSLRDPVEPLPSEQRPIPVGEAISSTPWGDDIWFVVQFAGTTVSVHRSGLGSQTRYAVTDNGGVELSDRVLGGIATHTNQSAAATEDEVLELGYRTRGHLVAIADVIAAQQLNSARFGLRRRAAEDFASDSVHERSRGGLTR